MSLNEFLTSWSVYLLRSCININISASPSEIFAEKSLGLSRLNPKPRDSTTWARNKMKFPTRTFHKSQSIWLKNIHNLIRKMWNYSRITKCKTPLSKGKFFISSGLKTFFFYFFPDFLINVNTSWALNLIYAKNDIET